MILFKLLSVYEITVKDQNIGRPVRIEIFQSSENINLYRPRVWVKKTYNVYPAAVNTGSKGEDLHRMHSSDDFNNDISLLIAEDDTFYSGKLYDNEEDVLEYTLSRLSSLFGDKLE